MKEKKDKKPFEAQQGVESAEVNKKVSSKQASEQLEDLADELSDELGSAKEEVKQDGEKSKEGGKETKSKKVLQEIQVNQKKAKVTTIFVSILLLVITLGCIGTTVWLLCTQVRMVEITGASYICVLEEGVEKEVEQVSSGTAKFDFREEGKNKSVASVGGKELKDGQYLKIVYNLKNVGSRDIDLKFEIVTNKRENIDITFTEDGEDFKLNGEVYIVSLSKDEEKQIIFYLNINQEVFSGACDIAIRNSFYRS